MDNLPTVRCRSMPYLLKANQAFNLLILSRVLHHHRIHLASQANHLLLHKVNSIQEAQGQGQDLVDRKEANLNVQVLAHKR